MSDTFLSEGGHEWPRRYTPAEVTLLANSLGRSEIDSIEVEDIQAAVEGYQWATSSDKGGVFHRPNKELRQRLKEILKLIGKGATREAIEAELKQLDAPTYQRLGSFNLADPQRLARAVRRLNKEIPSRGPDPKRARRQFIDDLDPIFYRLTGQRPGRRVHAEEYGPFRDFVRAALKPFKAAMGCEADIKAVLHQRLMVTPRRKTAVPSKS